MSFWKDYVYVDAYYEDPVTHKGTRWQRLLVSDVRKRIVQKAEGANCFVSVQRFKDSVSLLELERQREKQTNGANPKALKQSAGDEEAYELPDKQMHYAGLYFDFDCSAEKENIKQIEAIERSRLDAARLATWFIEVFHLQPPYIQAWFSGKKGFHLTVRPEPFDIRPHRHLAYILKNAAWELSEELNLETMDRSVYTVPRMWRVPNTVHPKTGRYKIELTTHELINWEADKIWDTARGPRKLTASEEAMPASHLYDPIEYQDIAPEPDAVKWWQSYYEVYDAYRDMKNLYPTAPIRRPEDGSDFPVCMQDILENGPKKGGPNRNRVVLPLAGFFRDAGIDKREATRIITDWTKKFYGDDGGSVRERIANGQSVIESAYRGGTRFACRFIRSVKGTGENGTVACVGEQNCPWVGAASDQNPATVPTIHLSEATKGCYVGTTVRTPVHVAAIAGRPFDLPLKGRILCSPDPSAKMCERCPNLAAGGKLEWKFTADERDVLNLVNVNDNQRKGAIKQKCGIPEKCFKHKIDVMDYSNLEEIQVIPMVDYAQVYYEDDGPEDDDLSKKSARHVVRLAYHLGHGIGANKKYMIEASVFGHPKDQRVCFLFDKAEPAQNDIDQFSMSEDLYQSLLVFQKRSSESVEQKLLEIHRDLTANVHQIGGRFDLSIAVDLCYHSVVGFKLADQFIHKGWFELLVMGDTGTGKTTMVERLMRHYGLGELVAGEDSKRTGLVYASIQMQGQWVLKWGKIPQNDRRILIIDEFAGIPPEEIGKMTQLRSEGRARGGGVNADYETFARTRLIFITNPRNNRGKLAGFNYGIEAIRDLFEEMQDLRRVDLAIIAEKDEVATDLINRRWDRMNLAHIYTADLCRNLVLWAWSREPHHIEWVGPAEDRVMTWADRLGDTYECDIPLAERADLRLKIARIAAATAARLFSTDSDAKKVLITEEHVDFAAKFVDAAYRKPAMSYFEYARKYKQDNNFTAERREDIRQTLLSFKDECDNIVATLLDIDLITRPTLTDMVNLEQDDLRRLWKYMVGSRLLRKTTKGYRKSPAFTKFLKTMGAKGSGYQGINDAFEAGSSLFETTAPSVAESGPEPGPTTIYEAPPEELMQDIGGDEPPF